MKVIRYLSVAVLFVLPSLANAYNDHRNARVDSLEAALRSKQPPKGRDLVLCYEELTRGYLNRDGAKAEAYARKALSMSYRYKGMAVRQSVLRYLGLLYYGRNQFDRALDYFHHSLALTDSMVQAGNYSKETIDDAYSALYGSIGNVYNMQDQSLLAIEFYQRALPIFERNGWLESQAILYHNVGELYNSMNNEREAERNFLLAIEKATSANDSLLIAMSQKGLGKILNHRGDIPQAKQTIEAAYAYYHSHQDEEKSDYAVILCELTQLYLSQSNRDVGKARRFAQEALSLTDDDLPLETLAYIYAVLCEVEMAQKNWQKAADYCHKSINIDPNDTYDDVECYLHLAEIYLELGDASKTQEAMHRAYGLMRQFSNENYQSSLSQMEVIYETEKKQAAIEKLRQENRWMWIGGTLVAVVLLLAALVFALLWRSSRLKKQREIMKATLDGELSERVRIAHGLHDRLGGLLSALKLKVHDSQEASNMVDEAISEMRNVAHHLLPDSLKRYGLRTALREFCLTLPHTTFAFMGSDHTTVRDEAIYCMAHELINNAVKHAAAKHIRVQLLIDEDIVAINISDDGKGFDVDHTDEGFGLRNIRKRVNDLQGQLLIDSTVGMGTEINLEIPLK